MNNDFSTGTRRLEVTLQKTSVSAFVGSTLLISGVFYKSYILHLTRERDRPWLYPVDHIEPF